MVSGSQVMIGAAAFSVLFFWLPSAYYSVGRVRSWAQGYTGSTVGFILLAWWAISVWGFFALAVVSGVVKVMFSLGMVWRILAPESQSREAVPVARAG